MNKALLVAKREYLYNVRRPGFLFAAFGLPIFLIVVMVVVGAVIASTEEDVERVGQVGYVDESGVLQDTLQMPEMFSIYDSEDEARTALDTDSIGAYFVIDADYISTGNVTVYSRSGIPEALHDQIDAYLVANLSTRIDSDIPVERFVEPVEASYYITSTGRTLNEGIFILVFLPFIFTFVFMMASQISASYLMNGVVEEKANRVMEILITTITPLQLLVGKILGLGALGLTQMLVWVGLGAAMLALGQSPLIDLPEGFGISFDLIPLDMVLITLVYFILSYFLFASVMAGIGVVAGSEQESRQYAGFISLALVVPYFFITTFFEDMNGTVPVVLSMIPITAPMAMIMRLGFGVVPLEQIVISLLILLVTTVVVVWGAARVFRWASLLYGKRITPRSIMGLIRRSPKTDSTLQEQVS